MAPTRRRRARLPRERFWTVAYEVRVLMSLAARPALSGNGKIIRCIAGSFLLRAAAAGAAELIAFYLADLEHVRPYVRGSMVIGLATMLFYLAEVSGALGFGALTDRHGPRRYLLLGPTFGAVAAIVMSLVAAIPTVVLARFFQGLSTAAAIPATLAFLSGECGQDDVKRGRVMSGFEVAAISGMAAGFIFVGIIWDRLGMLAFIPVTALYLVSFVVLWSVGRGMKPAQSEHHGIKLAFLRSPRAMRLVPAWLAVNAFLGVWLTHAAHQLKRPDNPSQLLVGGYTGQEISMYGASTLLLFVGGIAIWGVILGRIGSLRVMALSLVGLVLLAPSLYFLNHSAAGGQTQTALWLAAAAAALLVASGFTPAALAYLSKVAEEHAAERGAIMGLYSVLLGVGQAIGAISGGPAAYAQGADGMIGLSAIFTLCAVAAVIALTRSERRARRAALATLPPAGERVAIVSRLETDPPAA